MDLLVPQSTLLKFIFKECRTKHPPFIEESIRFIGNYIVVWLEILVSASTYLCIIRIECKIIANLKN